MGKESFMRFVEIDSEKRAEDKKVRKERADTFKTRASKAFQRGDYELALSCYNKAIDQVKDSCLLYTNRALTLIKLKKYDKVTETITDKLERLWKQICFYIKMGFRDENILVIIKEVFHCIMMKLLYRGSSLLSGSMVVNPLIQALYIALVQFFFSMLVRIFKDDGEPNSIS